MAYLSSFPWQWHGLSNSSRRLDTHLREAAQGTWPLGDRIDGRSVADLGFDAAWPSWPNHGRAERREVNATTEVA